MKKRLLLIVIYLAFISLGLPDSLLGAAWPSMYKSLGTPIHFAGIISMIVAAGTVISSLYSAKLIKRFGVSAVTTASVLLTALALLGFSFTTSFFFLGLLAIPLGLGAGCVDVALNNYVAIHYQAKHMNWLHCFWGVGAAIGPIIMGRYLAMGESWTAGYQQVGLIQLGLVILLVASFPLWTGRKQDTVENGPTEPEPSFRTLLPIPGIKSALAVFFLYCTIEATFGLWGASYLVRVRGYAAAEAATLVSLYYVGITIGRIFSGFITLRLNNQRLVYLGQGIIGLGIVVLSLPFSITQMPGFLLIGLGCAPIFPSLIHETPRNFGEKHSQTIIGMQMASAYIGITIMPLLFGKMASLIGYSSLSWFIAIVLLLKIYLTSNLFKRVSLDKRL